MTQTLPLVIFSDLDGTLLDHDSYAWAAAQPALDAVRGIGGAVVLASSKTAVEMAGFRRAMGLDQWPAIVENGAAILQPGARPSGGHKDYDALRSRLDQVPKPLRDCFEGFGDMSVDRVAQVTGLSLDAAKRAKARAASEPGLWTGTEQDLTAFLAALSDLGLTAREGGRFLTLSMGDTKADQMGRIIERLQPERTLALGDAPNDVEMLQCADFGVIVHNPHRAPLARLPQEDDETITRTKEPGPKGWNLAVLDFLNQHHMTGHR